MHRILFCLLLTGILLAAGPSFAGEGKAPPWRYNNHSSELPFPRSERAESVWASGPCWSGCGSYCTWGFAGCLQRGQDSQGTCVKLADKCDRYCQRQCRTMGGPLLPIELPWD